MTVSSRQSPVLKDFPEPILLAAMIEQEAAAP